MRKEHTTNFIGPYKAKKIWTGQQMPTASKCENNEHYQSLRKT